MRYCLNGGLTISSPCKGKTGEDPQEGHGWLCLYCVSAELLFSLEQCDWIRELGHFIRIVGIGQVAFSNQGEKKEYSGVIKSDSV